ncbi:Nn.00g016620.m01.CDS01 [Neocucurbitaria sp. VM-36]
MATGSLLPFQQNHIFPQNLRNNDEMANSCADCDRDSAFGDDDFFWTTNPMYSPRQPLAGTKRDADELRDDALPQTQSHSSRMKHRDEHIDPRVLCCNHCPEPCPELCDVRPAKRPASLHRVGEYHTLTSTPSIDVDVDCQFPDDCFEKFCQECNLDASCPPDCAVPCPGDSCPEDDACFDPHCRQKTPECTDHCVDPECTKSACPDEPCFCQTCDAQPCPLGDLNNECHFAHSAPTPIGTIYCYDNAPCHFQEGHHEHNNGLASFETYPCFSHSHDYTHADDTTTLASSAPTPALSHSNYTSLESAFTSEPSPALGQTSLPNCYLNISSEHCHIDNSCCHGPKRACGDCPTAPQQDLDLWNSSMAQGNGLANSFMTFGFNASPPTSSNPFSLDGSILGFNDQSWMLTASTFANNFPAGSISTATKLDYLASAVQHDILGPNTTTCTNAGAGALAGATESQQCTCRWQHAPGVVCLAIFDTAENLHKHIKTAHVDNCTHCFCQWEGCEAASKDFKQRSKLARHLLGHAGYRPYACSYEGCDKTFATNQAKDNHERTHTGERPYVCDRCGYTTTTHTQLQTHISALHEGKKPHKCRFCDFTCADSSNLSKHERTHQTLRPYRCPHPNCTFKPDCRWENLKRHLRRSSHCPQLLVETSEDYKAYREGVRREIEDWHKRNEDGGVTKTGRRKARA